MFTHDPTEQNEHKAVAEILSTLPPPAASDLSYEEQEAVYMKAIELLEQQAPVTANELALLWDEHSALLGTTIRTIGAAFEHRQMRLSQLMEQENNKGGRPTSPETIERVEDEALKATLRAAEQEKKKAEKAQSKALYEARLAKYARRRAAIEQARQDLATAEEKRKEALEHFNNQWNNYVNHFKERLARLKAIPADEWPGTVSTDTAAE